MAQPRFKQYTNLSRDPKEKKKIPVLQILKKGLILVVSLALIFAAGWVLIRIVPRSNSNRGEYIPPDAISEIKPYSQARWIMQDTHSRQLTVDLAWYCIVNLSSATSVAQLDQSGFRPFIFANESGEPVEILDSGQDIKGNISPFLFALVPPEGTTGSFISRRTLEKVNWAGQASHEPSEERIYINPDEVTSIFGQSLPQPPDLQEQYVCFLAQVWESAVSGYITLYQHPPESLEGMLDGIGLKMNPDNAWPFGSRGRMRVNVEGGLIDNKIVYWQVTLLDGSKHGQARYWDHYTSYDDPDTPENIITRDNNSPVVSPDEIQGTRQVLFSLDIFKNLLDEAGRNEAQVDE
ncbi:MAG: hypothetical protein NTY09_06130 [bacterium]|nr:hypothetical protein [bacterium]